MPILFVAIVYFITKDEPKTYNSNASVYTGIATGSSIVSMEESKLDLFGSRTAFDNLINIIKSRSTIEEVALRLFTSHMILHQPSDDIIKGQTYKDLMKIVPPEVKELVVKGDFETTLTRFKTYKDKDYSNFIYELIKFNHPNYSSKKILSKVKVNRIQSSDLIEISYASEDPGICQHTLEILIEVFIKEYSNIKVNQSDAVVRYFLGQLDVSNERLNQAENELLSFNRSNSIINYYEQTKHIASEKEQFDLIYQDIKMQNAAAESVLKVLEGKMSIREKTKVNSNVISDLRNQLSRINLEIAMKKNVGKLDDEGEKVLIDQLSALENQSYQLQKMLKDAIGEQYEIDNSPEGLPTGSILSDWLEKVIEFETTKAQLEIGKEKHQEFKDLFQNYAPLGATMKRLERKIDVAEREYLSLLHSLSLAKLKQQNVELNSNLKIVAAPFYPIESQPSKRKFLLIIAFMIGFILPAFTIIVLEFLDRNINNIYRAESMMGLSVAAIFPVLNAGKSLDFDFVKQRSLDIIARRLILNTESVEVKPKPDINLFFSIQDGEGKTELLVNLLNKLSSFGYRILLLSFNDIKAHENYQSIHYKVNNSFHRVDSIFDFEADLSGIVFEDFDYAFVEIPGILNHSYPIKLFRSSHHSFLVTRANRAWSKADKNALKDILEYTSDNKPQVILNGVALDEMETVLGDLPKHRSFIRRAIKNLFRLQFFSKKKLVAKDSLSVLNESRKKPGWFLWLVAVSVLLGLFIIGKVYIYPKLQKSKIKDVVKEEITIDDAEGVEIEELGETNISDNIIQQDGGTVDQPNAERPAIQVKYYVIGGIFRSPDNADECYRLYIDYGYTPVLIKESGDIYKVAVGVYNSKDEAEKVKNDFNRFIPNAEAWVFIDTATK